MDYVEEQRTEIEVLQSIYFDEFEFIDTPAEDLDAEADREELEAISEGLARFSIRIKVDVEDLPDIEKTAVHEKDSQVPEKLVLRVVYTKNYPDSAPILRLVDSSGELFQSERDHLESVISETLESNAGLIVVFAVVSALRDCLETKIIKGRRGDMERLYAEKIAKAEEEEKQRYVGTKVTPESFNKWKEGFDREMRMKGTELGYDILKFSRNAEAFSANGKLTGKQLFEKDKSLVTSDTAFRNEQGADENEDDVDFDADLFRKEMEDLNIDDDSETPNAVVAGFYN